MRFRVCFRRAFLWGLLIMASGATQAQMERAGFYRIQATVTPRQVPADGKSQARVRVEVRTSRGGAAPDGTQVVLHTNIGQLSLGATGYVQSLTTRTSGGFATVYASSNVPGTATISIQVADARSFVYLDFLPEGEVATPEVRLLDVKAQWVGYSPDLNLIEARDRVQLKYGKLLIECAAVAQIDVEGNIVKAQNVVFRRGEAQLEGEDVYFDLAAKRGVLRRFTEGGLQRVYFDAIGLRPLPEEWEIPPDAFRLDQREGATWFVARSLRFFLQEKIVLRNATLWMGEKKMFSFPPYWIIALPGYTGASNTEAVGMTSSGGLALDFPFFYRVTETATGSVRIQHGASAGSVMARRGWSLALSEEYRLASGVEGEFLLSGLPRRDWGFEWRDARPLGGNAFGYFNFSMPDHQSVFADANVYDYNSRGRLNLRAYFDAPQNYSTSYGLVGDWLMEPQPLGKSRLAYRLGVSLGARRYPGEDETVLVNELYQDLSLGNVAWGKKTKLEPQISNLFSWDTSGAARNSLRTDLRLEHQFQPTFLMGLDYSAEWQTSTDKDTKLQQLVGLDLRANQGARWASFLSATYDLSRSDLYGFFNFDYQLSKQWRLGLLATYYDMEQTSYRDVEISLRRTLGNREISLTYSTQTGKFFLTFGGFRFY